MPFYIILFILNSILHYFPNHNSIKKLRKKMITRPKSALYLSFPYNFSSK